jgi:hypothetical protein
MTASQKYDLLVGQYHQDVSLTHLLNQQAKRSASITAWKSTPRK